MLSPKYKLSLQMALNIRSLSLYLLSSILVLHAACAIAKSDSPIHAICSNSKNYTVNEAFSNNLHQLMFLLATKAPQIGFAIGSAGHGNGRVNGLALCRGDVRRSACSKCVRTANARVRHLCPYDKEAIVWLDECMLRYSDAEFFGEIDYAHSFSVFSSGGTSDNSTRLINAEVVHLLVNRLKKMAYLSPLLFATGKMALGDSQLDLYGLVQCTKDLSGGDCNRCLEAAIAELPCGKRVARVVSGSCNVRYELHPFFDDAQID